MFSKTPIWIIVVGHTNNFEGGAMPPAFIGLLLRAASVPIFGLFRGLQEQH